MYVIVTAEILTVVEFEVSVDTSVFEVYQIASLYIFIVVEHFPHLNNFLRDMFIQLLLQILTIPQIHGVEVDKLLENSFFDSHDIILRKDILDLVDRLFGILFIFQRT